MPRWLRRRARQLRQQLRQQQQRRRAPRWRRGPLRMAPPQPLAEHAASAAEGNLFCYVSGSFLHLVVNALPTQNFIRGVPARCTYPSVNAPPPQRECDKSMCACADKSWFLRPPCGRGGDVGRLHPGVSPRQGSNGGGQPSSKQGLGGSTGRCIFCGTRQMAAGRGAGFCLFVLQSTTRDGQHGMGQRCGCLIERWKLYALHWNGGTLPPRSATASGTSGAAPSHKQPHE